ASMIHELSVTRCARRVNNQTLVVPTVRRAITANKPASQASDSATFQSNLFQKGATGFGVTSNRGETGFEAGNSAPMSKGRRSASRRASGSGSRSSASAATLALEPTTSRAPSSTEAIVASDGSADIRQDGNATVRIGSASRLAMATL